MYLSIIRLDDKEKKLCMRGTGGAASPILRIPVSTTEKASVARTRKIPPGVFFLGSFCWTPEFIGRYA